MNLYLLHTNGCGTFYVIAASLDKANEKLQGLLSKSDYATFIARKLSRVDVLATEIQDSLRPGFANFSSDNRLIMPDSIDKNQ